MKGLYLFNDFVVRLDPHSAVGWVRGIAGRTWQAWDSELLEFFYKKISAMQNPTVIDVGAANGSFSMLAKFHPMIVYAFEPIPEICEVLRVNLALNGLEGCVSVSQVALSDKKSLVSMYIPIRGGKRFLNRASLGRGLGDLFDEWEEVPNITTCTLDSFGLLPNVIKIDAEGAEKFVLRGGKRTIRRYKPRILIECDERSLQKFDGNRDMIIGLLYSWGYRKFRPVGSRSDLWIE